ncbi:hypothetical protein M8C21_033093, partial [Ambrosia artemisiifolia]
MAQMTTIFSCFFCFISIGSPAVVMVMVYIQLNLDKQWIGDIDHLLPTVLLTTHTIAHGTNLRQSHVLQYMPIDEDLLALWVWSNREHCLVVYSSLG